MPVQTSKIISKFLKFTIFYSPKAMISTVAALPTSHESTAIADDAATASDVVAVAPAAVEQSCAVAYADRTTCRG